MKKARKLFYKSYSKLLTDEAKEAKSLVERICKVLSAQANANIYPEVSVWKGDYEGLIIDTRTYKDVCVDDYEDYKDHINEKLGIIFFGGHFSKKRYHDAYSRAWISLLEDCIGIGEEPEHNLTAYLEDIGPKVDFQCKSIEELKLKLAVFGI